MDHDELLSPLRDPRDRLVAPDWPAMEARLLEAFTRERAAAAAAPRPRQTPWWRWMAAAATIMMAAAITFYTVPSRLVTPTAAPEPPPPKHTASPSPPARTVSPPAPAPVPAPSPARPRSRAAVRPAARAADTQIHEFVPLPGAFALPDFESGRIVRVEVPVAALPAYGIDLVPDAAPTAVEADFLIGQDGLPRAIRLTSARLR